MIIFGFIKNWTYLKEVERGSNSGDSKDKVIRCKFYSIFSLLAKVKTIIKKMTISISLYSAKIEPYVYLLGYLPGLKNINIIQNFFVGACAIPCSGYPHSKRTAII